jgi:hypothetical protein
MSVPNDRTSVTQTPSTTTGRLRPDGTRIFRMGPPVVIWWVWIAILAFSLGDYLFQAHRLVSLKFALGALAITGLVYACALWPAVIASDRGVEIRNPVRRFFVPWAAVRGIYLADSVEVQCGQSPPKKDKTVYSWALSSPRRSRARAQLRAWQWDQGKRGRPGGYAQLPDQAKSVVKMTTAEVMARELAAMSEEAKFRSVVAAVEADSDPDQDRIPAGEVRPEPLEVAGLAGADGPAVLSPGWSWPPLAAFFVPAIAFLVVSLVK